MLLCLPECSFVTDIAKTKKKSNNGLWQRLFDNFLSSIPPWFILFVILEPPLLSSCFLTPRWCSFPLFRCSFLFSFSGHPTCPNPVFSSLCNSHLTPSLSFCFNLELCSPLIPFFPSLFPHFLFSFPVSLLSVLFFVSLFPFVLSSTSIFHSLATLNLLSFESSCLHVEHNRKKKSNFLFCVCE